MGGNVVVAFFALGFIAHLLGSRIDFPRGLYQTLTLFLLLAIGLKGGIALDAHLSPTLLLQCIAVMAFGMLLPLIAYPLLHFIGGWSKVNSAATAAHYGSVSVGTFAVGIAFLEAQGIAYEAYLPLFVALLEFPAIIVGLLLAAGKSEKVPLGEVLKESLLNQGVLLLIGGIGIGLLAGAHANLLMPFFGDLFMGVLALFLLHMGQLAGKQIHTLKRETAFVCSFAVFMPLIGAALAGLLGGLMQLSIGGVVLMAVLGASASYIAVPAALGAALPKANISLALTASLAVTFPFNVVVGIPAYFAIVQYWQG